MSDRFLPGVPGDLIEEMFAGAPGNEIESGKFDHPESSPRLTANAFGYFVMKPGLLPPLPGYERGPRGDRVLSLEGRAPPSP